MGTDTPNAVDLDRYCTTPYVRHQETGQPPATVDEEKSIWDCCWCCCPCFFKKKSIPPRHCTEKTKDDLDSNATTSERYSNDEPDVEQTYLSPSWYEKQKEQYISHGVSDTPTTTETGTPDVRALPSGSRQHTSRHPIDIPNGGRNRPHRHEQQPSSQAVYSRTPDPGQNKFA